MTISSVSDKKLEKLRRKEERKVGRALARGEGEPLLEWLSRSGVGFAALCEGDWEAPAPKPLAEQVEQLRANLVVRAATEGDPSDPERAILPSGSGVAALGLGLREGRAPVPQPPQLVARARLRRGNGGFGEGFGRGGVVYDGIFSARRVLRRAQALAHGGRERGPSPGEGGVFLFLFFFFFADVRRRGAPRAIGAARRRDEREVRPELF